LNADQPAPRRPDDDAGALARLLAGGRHNRLLILGDPPGGLGIGETRQFERVVRMLRPGQPGLTLAGHSLAVGDPAQLPFVEALFDRALVTSPLPSGTARTELRELWRIMSPAALALLVVKARRPWQVTRPGWLTDDLAPVLEAAMFEVLEHSIETVPDRHHLVLVGKRDGLRAAPIGKVQAVGGRVTA
jgi:hypothetical protein